MKKQFITAVAMFLFLSGVHVGNAANKSSVQSGAQHATLHGISPVEKQVRDVINLHIDGIRKGDAAVLKTAWDMKNAQVKHVVGGRVQSASIAKSIELWAAKPAPKATGEILSVDVVGKQMAMAKLRLSWHGSHFTDYLTLFKTAQGWKIVEKTYVGKSRSPYARF